MTDRLGSLTVVLEHDIRDDDAESLMNAIRQLRCVLSVKGDVSDPTDYIARSRVTSEIRKKLFKALE